MMQTAIASDEEPEDEDALVLRLAAGESDAMATIVDNHLAAILGCAGRILSNRADGEDVAQETFLRLMKKAPDWKPGGPKLRSWLIRVATNLCIDRYRANKRGAAPRDEIDDIEDLGARSIEGDISARIAVRKALAGLPERQRVALVLVHFEGFSGREAADALSVSEEAIESLLARARRRLREELADVMNDLTEH